MSNDAFLDLPDTVPARMVNEFVYCPRLAYLEWVQGDFEDSADTVEGRFRHRVVDREGGRLPAPEEAESEDAAHRLHARSVWLSASEEQLTARIDLLEGEGLTVTPVDYKRGAAPDHLPEHAWEADRVQVCAQGLVLRANGYTCDGAVLYYAESKTRVPVPFDEALVTRTRQAVQGLRALAAGGQIPPPLRDSPKCVRCSLAGICLPDETNLLAITLPNADGETTAATTETDGERVRRLMPARDDALPLYVQEQGARVGKSGEVFEVSGRNERLGQARIFETSQIALFGNVQITTQALAEALDRNIPVAFFSTGGWFRGLAQGMSHKNVELRLSQYAVATDPKRSLLLAAAFMTAKIRNCRTLLMRNHPAPPPATVDSLNRLARETAEAPNAVALLGLEAMAAKLYFGTFNGMLKARAEAADGWRFDFNGRNRRPPRDPINALLSYAYSLLAKDLTVTALAVGLDPFLGFFHRPRYGRPSLALDLMEEYRPIIADSVVLTAVNTGIVTAGDFIQRGPAVMLKPEARNRFLRTYESRLDALVTHPIFGYRISYRRVLEVQVRLLGRALTGEIPGYPAFTTR